MIHQPASEFRARAFFPILRFAVLQKSVAFRRFDVLRLVA